LASKPINVKIKVKTCNKDCKIIAVCVSVIEILI